MGEDVLLSQSAPNSLHLFSSIPRAPFMCNELLTFMFSLKNGFFWVVIWLMIPHPWRELELFVFLVSGRMLPTSVLPQLLRERGFCSPIAQWFLESSFLLGWILWQLLIPWAIPSPTAVKGLGDAVAVTAALKFLSAPCYESLCCECRRRHWPVWFLLSSAGFCPETQPGETPAAATAQVDGTDLASPMSPRTSKSRMSMKLRRSSGSANKS